MLPWAESCPTVTSIIMPKAKIRLWAVCLWLIVWQCAAMLAGHDFLLASPAETLLRFFQLASTAGFWKSAIFTLCRIFGGFLLGTILGTVFAALSHACRRIEELLAPLMAVLRAIPVASFVVVALIWVPSKNLSVLISFLIVFPLIYNGVLAELLRTDEKMLEMARVFRMNPLRRTLYVHALPAAKGFAAACVTAMGLAWKSGVAAELISIPAGSIGERLYQAKVYLMTGDLFAWTLLIVLLSMLCARVFTLLLKAVVTGLERM